MKKIDFKGNWQKILLLSAAFLVIGGTGWYVVNSARRTNQASTNVGDVGITIAQKPTQVNADTAKPAEEARPSDEPRGMTASIDKYDPAGLLNASYTRKTSNFNPWQDSKVSVVYRDFNNDGTNDAFVWAKIPGTEGNSFAAVWTMDSKDKPKELWYLPSSLYIAQSSWSVNSQDALVNKGKKDEGGTIVGATNSFHWQVSTTASGFVLEPAVP